MRFLAACFEIWTGIYDLNSVFKDENENTSVSRILRKIVFIITSGVMGYCLCRSRMMCYVSPENIVLSILCVGCVAAVIKRKNFFKIVSVLGTTYLLMASMQILLTIGLISPSSDLMYDLLVGIWPFTVFIYLGVDVWMLLFIQVLKKRKKEIEELVDNNFPGIFCSDLVLLLIIVFWSETTKGTVPEYFQIASGFPIFAILIFIIVFGVFADIISRFKEVERENETLLVREEIARKQYEELSELISQNRQMVHDIKNHLLVIKEFAKAEENKNIQAYIDEISRNYAVSMSKRWTENQVVDFVLNQKILKAEKKNIEVVIKTGAIQEIPLDESEICALFGNLLDNAIEAAEKVQEEKRWIEVYISQKKSMLFMEMANNFRTAPVFENGEIVSTKGTSHGYGLKSVKRIVDKYDGMFTYKVGNHIFRINISFLSLSKQKCSLCEGTLYEQTISCDNENSLSEKNAYTDEKGTKRGTHMKKKIVSIIFYILNLGLFIFPWIRIGEESYNFFQFTIKNTTSGMMPFIEQAGLPAGHLSMLQGGVSIEIFLMLLYLVFSVIYLITVLRNKKLPFNLATLAVGVVIAYLHNQFPGTLGTLASAQLTTAISLFFILIPAAEFFTRMVMERWKETVEESRAYAAEEKAWKEEVKTRLAFAGKYDTPFYRVVWKNFKANWKDYILLLFCGILIIGFVVIGFGIQKIMSVEHSLEGIQMLNGLNSILMNAILPLAIVSVFIVVMLLFYYLKCRAKNYGVFLTLGMRRKALYYFAGLEFLSVFILSVILGGLLGTGVLALFTHYSEVLLGTAVDFSVIGFKTYLKAIGTVLLVFGASALAAKEIFVDFNVGKSTDLRAIGEPLPMRWRKRILAVGILICAFCLWQYSLIRNYEKIMYLIIFFAGLFIIIRYGIAEYLIRSRRKKKYFKRVVTESQLFHKSKTASGYIFALAIMQICVLFYFSFQVISPALVQDADVLFPYDMICIADDEDADIFAKMQEQGITGVSVPMVRVTNYDTTEKWEGNAEPASPQGQHIGISESTYHELKKRLDPEYEVKDLGLDPEGNKIYVVHQQDKSMKAQPLDFYGTAKKPILMVGQPTVGDIELARLSRNHADTAFRYREVAGEEFGSLVGTFRQGLRENVVVFSDEYFEEAKTLWEITDVNSGLLTTGEYFKLRYGDFENLRKGPTKLVLFENIPEEKTELVEEYMQEFRERHADDEAYDASVASYYTKADGMANLQTEKYMKMVMNTLVITIFFVMNIILVAIKMLSELDANRRRADFLTCMGMYKKDRDKLIMKEILVDHHLIPMVISMIAALLFTLIVSHARMYSAADIQNYLKLMVPMWAAYLLGSTAVLTILSVIYARTVEGKKYARRS